jgi:hypothetical protein
MRRRSSFRRHAACPQCTWQQISTKCALPPGFWPSQPVDRAAERRRTPAARALPAGPAARSPATASPELVCLLTIQSSAALHRIGKYSVKGEIFDPLNLQDKFDLNWMREAEIKHGRTCMLAVVGFVANDAGLKFPGPAFEGISSFEAHDAMCKSGHMWALLAVVGVCELVHASVVVPKLDGDCECPARAQAPRTLTQERPRAHGRRTHAPASLFSSCQPLGGEEGTRRADAMLWRSGPPNVPSQGRTMSRGTTVSIPSSSIRPTAVSLSSRTAGSRC